MAVFSTALVAGVLHIAADSFLASVSAFALNAAVGVGVSLLAKKLQEPKDQKQTNGVQGTLQAGGDVPRSIIFGRTCTAGSLVYANTWGTTGKVPNAYFTQVIALADFPVSQLTGLWVNGAPVTVDTNDTSYGDWGYPVTEYNTGNNNHMWIKFYDGTQTVADPFLVNTVSSAERPYQATRVGVGVAYAVVTSQVDDELFTGFPTFRFEIQGSRLYDVSRDSTAGGDGAQRWNDPSTWGGDGDDLPAVQIYNILRGLSYTGAWLYGLQSLTQARLPSVDWIAQINKCRADIAGPNGLEATYLTSMEVSVDTEIGTTIESFLTGCQGRLNEAGGIYKLRAGAPDAAVFAFSDGDILSTEEQTYTPFPGLADLVNGVSATYPEPAEAWNTKTAPPLYGPDFERQDGNRRLMTDIQLPMVYRSSQVQRILKSALEEARRARRLTLVLEPRAGVLEPGDIVAFTSDRNGFVNKLFRVDGVGDRANLDVLLQLTEVDPSDYDWDQEHDYTPPVFGPLGPVMPPAQIMEGWTVEKATISDANGVPRRPAIKIGCAADLQDTMAVWVQVRIKETGIVVFDSSSTAYAPPYSWILSGDWCLPAETYEARGRYLPYSRRATEWSAWLTVTTDDIRLSFAELEADIVSALQTLQDWISDDLPAQIEANAQAVSDAAQAILDEAQERADAIAAATNSLSAAIIAESQARADAIAGEEQARIDAIASEQAERVAGALEASVRYRNLVSEIAAIRDYAADLANASYEQKEQLRQTINTRIGDVVASFTDQITVAVSANAALALRVTTLEADTDTLQAQVTQVDQARADGDQALADRMSLLSAGTDNQFDPAGNALWTFDTTVMGWTGNGNPTVANGYLRPASQAADPYVVSPAGLAVSANVYRQVRARIRRTGVPAWEGLVWWKSASDGGWDVSRQQALAEPEFDLDGIALLTFNMPWSGSIDQIRIDLSTAQTATNYVEFDWIAIGSPSPGASRAELAAEQQARASGDGANAQSITALQAALNTTNGTVQAQSTAIGSLQGSVTALGNQVTAQGQSLTALSQTVAGKASIDSVDQLSNKIDSMGGPDGVSSLGQSVRAIRNSLLPQSMEGVEQDFANFLDKMNGQSALSLVSQTLTSKITLTQNSLDILSQAVTQVQATLPGLASSTALDAVTSRVTATEGSITAISSSVTALQAALPDKADASALSDLQATVSQQGNSITSQGQAITQINTTLPQKANAADVNTALAAKASTSALNALQGTVSQIGDQVTAQGQSLTALSQAVDGKASIDSVDQLAGQISGMGGPDGVSSLGQSVRAIRNSLLPQSMEGVEQDFANFLDKMNGQSALSLVSQTLTSKITLTQNSLDILSQAVTQVQATLPGLATSTALDALTSRVTATEGSITAISSSVTSLQAALPDKADGSALQSLALTVSQQGNTITSQGQAITSLQGSVADKADASALTALQTTVSDQAALLSSQGQAITQINATLPNKANTADVNTALAAKASADALTALQATVTQQGDDLTSQGQSITQINATLPNKANTADVNTALAAKASTSALNALQGTVTDQGNTLSAQSTALTQVTASVGEATADGNWRMEAVAGPSGYVRYGAQLRYDNGKGYRSAGWYSEVPSDPNSPTRTLFQANQLALLDNGSVPFAVSGGVTYLMNANIQYADIGTLQVGRSNIRQGAISRVDYSGLGAAAVGTNDTPITGLTADHGAGAAAVIVHSAFSLSGTGPTNSNGVELPVKLVISIWDSQNNAYTAAIEYNFMGRSHFAHEYNFTPPAGSTSTTFRFDVRVISGTGVTAYNRTIRILSLYGK